MGLDFSPRVADFATGMEGSYSPSLSCKLKGYPPDCIALHMGVPFSLNSNPTEPELLALKFSIH